METFILYIIYATPDVILNTYDECLDAFVVEEKHAYCLLRQNTTHVTSSQTIVIRDIITRISAFRGREDR